MLQHGFISRKENERIGITNKTTHMSHNTPWTKKEKEMLVELVELGCSYEFISHRITQAYGNERSASACATMYCKIKNL